MIDIRAVTHVLITNLVCIRHLIIGLKIEEFYFFLTHCTKLTKTHENKFANSIKTFFPNTCKTVCVNPFVLPNLEPKCAPGDPILYPESIFCYSP